MVPTRGNRVRMVVLTLLLTMFAAGACNLVINLLQAGADLDYQLAYALDEARFIFFISSGIMWLILLGLVALTGRLYLSIGAFTAVVVVIGLANAEKLELRQEPIYPSDIAFVGQAEFLQDMVGPGTVAVVISLSALIVLVGWLTGRVMAQVFPPVRRRTEPERWRRLLAARLVAVVLVGLALGYVAQFNASENKVRAGYDAAGAQWAFWFQKVNYVRHGFVAGFLYNLDVPAMAEPRGYDRQTMDDLTRRYTRVADRMNHGRSTGAMDDVNVVVILSEAFSDPTLIDGPTLAEDPIPFTRSLMSSTRSGTMLAQLFGGGTANMEFETLTGMSLSQFLPQMNSPYQMLVPERPTFPSAVGYFEHRAHDAVAIHPYMTSMYKRHEVYPTLGFSEFVHDSTMQSSERIDGSPFISDAAAFAEVQHQLAESERPALVNLVTMQNHFPMAGKYDDPMETQGVSGTMADHLGGYARGLQHSDDALRDFIGDLEASDEKTAVVFYGDHAPAFWEGDVYKANGDAAFRRTPYFMWTNFKDLPEAAAPITSPIYFLPTLLDDLEAPLPPYYALLTQLQEEIPAMEQGEYFLPDGSQVSESGLGPRARELLTDYRLVQYDLAVGERFSQDELFYPDAR